ncbi:phosphotransferase family protein [Cohnella silvisoli]|uniref:Aminoglycoside phosphotransferase family protein n=1 Tax=Cohnella silvisoli TaxID=2873699 RepID=A0ABV1KVN7_9BACL|nr:aminoglycoside phosphotransferase family protein [Cohnella silvisoli]MCD9023518.1 aminoglycoside phosphotransferase family protein [Cohnella silvisoli]
MGFIVAKQVERYVSSLNELVQEREVAVQQLNGGVSGLIWKVSAGDEKWVLKQALGKLDVAEDWFADVGRIEREEQAMRFLEPMMPEGSVPQVVYSDEINHLYMMTCAPDEAAPWKSLLMDGEFQPEVARHAGVLLREMHESSRRCAGETKQVAFEDMTFFRELRIDPFHRHLIGKYPELESELEALIADLEENRTCLVHGDFSPKNMLVDKEQRVVLLDYEVVHWGNPVFDLAFLLAHLLLKGWALERQADALRLMEDFLWAYGFNPDKEARLIGHTGALLLSRIDGKSTVGYVKGRKLKNLVRRTAMAWLRQPNDEVATKLKEVMKG